MSFVLAIDTERWRTHQDEVRQRIEEAGGTLVPVAKGNGYGVGNDRLAQEVARMGLGTLAVGTVHEVVPVLAAQESLDVLVLEPLMMRDRVARRAWDDLATHPAARRVIHTISSVDAAEEIMATASPDSPRRLVLEGVTSLRRFGMTEDEMAAAISLLAPALESGALVLDGLTLHLPLAVPEVPRVGSVSMLTSSEPPEPIISGSARVHEVVTWGMLWATLLEGLAGLDSAGALWASHLTDDELADVHRALPDLPIHLRVGTRLWLGDRGSLQARGTVLALHRCSDGEAAGYHQRRTAKDGYVLVVSGGTSHGVAMTAPRAARSMRARVASAGSGALEAAGRTRSPFHLPTGGHAWFLEPPHMHVSMLRIPRGTIPPPVGELIDCDVRFTTVQPDVVMG